MLRYVLLLLLSVAAISVYSAEQSEFDLEASDNIVSTFTAEEEDNMKAFGETQEFQAEVNRLMEIIINSLYKTRDIFLRELISNGNDALDKIRYQSLTDSSVLESNKDLNIKVQIDKDARTITIQDTGIGMTAAELTKNLGTVAHSGTASFFDAFAKASESGDNPMSLIGQFGVGFYSAFLVADEVIVISKANSEDKQNIWRSSADGKFTVIEDPRGDTLQRGTQVILKIKEDAEEFLDADMVEKTIKRYSEFIQFPIYLHSSRTEQVAIEAEPKDEDFDSDELSAEDEEEEPEQEFEEHQVFFWKRLNSNKPLWSRRPNDVDDEEYDSFYQAFSKENDLPLAHTHFKAEGELEFDSILFLPGKAPHGMYDNYYQTKSALRLYVRRVLVADQFEDIIPRYLNFIKGLVDSNDLPLNVNREDLQKNKIMTLISRKLTRKALDMLRKLAQEDEEDEDEEEEPAEDLDEDEPKEVAKKDSKYLKFWEEFGKSLKLGVLEDERNKKRLVELLRFPTTFSPDVPVSLASYVTRMKPGQKTIYYISAASLDEAENSPFLERFRRKGYEVLYFVDNLDEYLQLQEYDDVPVQAITKENVELDGSKMKEFLAEKEMEFEELKDWLKDVYGSAISRIQISSTLDTTPMAIGTASYGTSARMEQIAKAQAFGAQYPMRATRILQINYRHPIIKELQSRVASGDADDNDELKDLALLLLDSASIQSGFTIDADEQAIFASRISRIVGSGLDVSPGAELDPEPEFADDVEEEEDEDFEEEDEEEEEEEAELDDDDKEEL